MAGWSGQEGNINMVKIKRKSADGPRIVTVADLKVGPVEREDDNPEEFYPVVVASRDERWWIGHDGKRGWFLYDPSGETGWERLEPFGYFAKKDVLLRNLARWISEDVPVPAVSGDKDRHNPDAILVPLDKAPEHPAFPIVKAYPSTFFRFDRKTGQVEAVVTIDAEGVHLGWDTCKECSRSVNRCVCASGATMPAGIQWCVERSASGWAAPTNVGKSAATTKDTKPLQKPVPTARAATPSPDTKTASSPVTDSLVASLDDGTLDLDALNKAAEAAATKATRKVKIKRKR